VLNRAGKSGREFVLPAWSEKSVEVFHEDIFEDPIYTISTDNGTVRTTVYHPFWVLSNRIWPNVVPLES